MCVGKVEFQPGDCIDKGHKHGACCKLCDQSDLYRCDQCKKDIELGDYVVKCPNNCDFDVCMVCYRDVGLKKELHEYIMEITELEDDPHPKPI